MADYTGIEDRPELVAWSNFPGRGTTWSYEVGGKNLQVYVTEKAKKVRVFLDHKELVAK